MTQMLSVTLWPYTLHMANEVHNATPLKDGEHSPLELFAQVDVSPKLCHFHTFGSPITYSIPTYNQEPPFPSGNQEYVQESLGAITKSHSLGESSSKSMN